MVRLLGLEPSTSRLSGGCSNQLSYKRVCAHQGLVACPVRPTGSAVALAVVSYGSQRYASALRADSPSRCAPGRARDGHIKRYSRQRLSVLSAHRCAADVWLFKPGLPRKEVIQPHLPIRLPCYDLVPLTGFTFGASPLAVRTTTSGATNSGGLTGGVYKAQEHIHRGVADPRLLAIPASCGRIAAHNLN
jgi:hypothetical protein